MKTSNAEKDSQAVAPIPRHGAGIPMTGQRPRHIAKLIANISMMKMPILELEFTFFELIATKLTKINGMKLIM